MKAVIEQEWEKGRTGDREKKQNINAKRQMLIIANMVNDFMKLCEAAQSLFRQDFHLKSVCKSDKMLLLSDRHQAYRSQTYCTRI